MIRNLRRNWMFVSLNKKRLKRKEEIEMVKLESISTLTTHPMPVLPGKLAVNVVV